MENPKTPAKPDTKSPLTSAERQELKQALDRLHVVLARRDNCDPDAIRAEAKAIGAAIGTDVGDDPAALDSKVERFLTLHDRLTIPGRQSLSRLKSHFKSSIPPLFLPISAITAAGGEVLAAPIDKQADAAAAAQDSEHARLNIAPAPCPAAQALRRQASVIRAVARRVNEGDALRRALESIGCGDLLD